MEWAEERVDEVSALNIIFSQATLYEYLNGSRGRALTRTKPPKGSALTRSHEEKNPEIAPLHVAADHLTYWWCCFLFVYQYDDGRGVWSEFTALYYTQS